MVDIVELQKSDFWKRKFRKAVMVRDTNKSGSLSRSDFEIIVQRYKNTAESPTEKIDAFSKSMFSFCDELGLVNSSVEQSYDEFEGRWLSLMSRDNYQEMFKYMFICLDGDGDGFINSNEWKIHNASLGISAESATESFNAMDKDEDGKITMTEFVDYHCEFFFTTENKLNSAILFGPI